MTHREESYVLDSLDELKTVVYENNRMLREICYVINVYLSHHHQENEEDFGRNVLANLISNAVELTGMKK